VNTLTPDNRLVETVTLPQEHLPQNGYALRWSGSRILAEAKAPNRCGVVYFTSDGGVHLANVVLFDRQGELIRKYPESEIRDETEPVYKLPAPQGTQVITYATLTENGLSWIHWLDGETAVINCHSRIVLYDFAADTGRVLDDMSELVSKHGKFGVYYGANDMQCGVVDGGFYYLAHRNEEKSNTVGTIWRADKNGAVELLDGREFWHLFVGDHALIAAAGVAGEGDANEVACLIDPGTMELREVWRGDIYLPFTENGPYVAFAEYDNREGTSVVRIYRRDTGEYLNYSLGAGNVQRLLLREAGGSLRLYYTLYNSGWYTDWAYDTAAGTAAKLPAGSMDSVRSVSPDGSRMLRYRGGASPRLWVSPWEF